MTGIQPMWCPKCGRDITKTDIVMKHIKYCNIIQRADGRVEWQCSHGVGHTIWAPKEMGENGYIHGCCGCCNSKEYKDEVKKWSKYVNNVAEK
jgi:hypothetical protein